MGTHIYSVFLKLKGQDQIFADTLTLEGDYDTDQTAQATAQVMQELVVQGAIANFKGRIFQLTDLENISVQLSSKFKNS